MSISEVSQASSREIPHIVIVGGGTSGWMAANMLAHRFNSQSLQRNESLQRDKNHQQLPQHTRQKITITLIESSAIPTVGVGEGSTPFFKQFFDTLGIAERDWMPACNATYKTGIEFPGWCGDAGPQSYFHPFYSEIDNEQAPVFFAACEARRKGYAAYSHPDDFFVTSHLRHQHKAPVGFMKGEKHQMADYGYHFDAGLLAKFLREHAIQQGVRWIDDKVEGVKCHPSGDIAAVVTEGQGELTGAYFIDCTGFRGKLIRQTLQRNYQSLRNRLYCDAAVALPVNPVTEEDPQTAKKLPCTTKSEAVDGGWIWSIPLSHRTGSGMVFSREFMAPVEAVEQLVNYHGLPFEAAEKVKHLSWEPGRLNEHWYKNCIAIGLSQGFLEPLEAPMLNITQQSIDMMMAQLQKLIDHPQGEPDRKEFNRQVNYMIDGTCDYLQAHYLLNKRSLTNTQPANAVRTLSDRGLHFWKAVRNNPHRSDALNDLLTHWQTNQSIDAAMTKHWQSQVYLKTSWFCLFSGLDAFEVSTVSHGKSYGKYESKPMPQHSQQLIHSAIERARALANAFPDHQDVIASYSHAQMQNLKERSIA